MKLQVKITYKDDKVGIFDCVDFPYIGGEWITLYLPGFKRTMLRSEGIAIIDYYFKEGKLK